MNPVSELLVQKNSLNLWSTGRLPQIVHIFQEHEYFYASFAQSA